MAQNMQTNGRAAISVPVFRGLMQYGGGINGDARCARYCQNAATAQGVLSPMRECLELPGILPDPIETLAVLNRRYHTADSQKQVLLASAGGQLYWRVEADEGWHRIPVPAVIERQEYRCSRFSWVSYEINPEESDAPVDVLLLSNAEDGMIMVRGDDLSAQVVHTPEKFGVIARHNERIWGTAIPGQPDKLMYSAPYDPFDWNQNDDYPEDGAGDVLQPSWDGDSFTALASFGGQLMAFKRTGVWRILGVTPGEYTFHRQFGTGAPCAGAIAVDGARILLLGQEGVNVYNGETVSPFEPFMAADVFARLNHSAMDGACACMWQNRFFCAVPLDDSPVNNAVIIYDAQDDTWLLRTGVQVSAFLSTPEALYLADLEGRACRWRDDSGPALGMRWTGLWQQMGGAHLLKSGFVLYVSVACETPVTLRMGVETERGARWKTITFQPGGGTRRVRFGGSGRKVRWHIESSGGENWQLSDGLRLEAELEGDW